MDSSLYIFLGALGILGGFFRGTTAIGPGVVFIAGATWFLPLHDAIVLSALLDCAGGGIANLALVSRRELQSMLPVAIAFVTGSAIGSLLLPGIASGILIGVVAGVLFLAAALMLFRSPRFSGAQESGESVSSQSKRANVLTGAAGFAGLVGGMTGMPGPILASYMAISTETKKIRNKLLPILLLGAAARVTAYASTYQVATHHLTICALLLPCLIAGIWIGNRVMKHISDIALRTLTSALVAASALQLTLEIY